MNKKTETEAQTNIHAQVPIINTEGFRALVEDIHRLERTYSRTSKGNELLILGTMFRVMTITNAALTLPRGSSYLFMAQSILSVGLSDTSARLIGPELNKVTELLAQGLLSPAVWGSAPQVAEELLLKNLVKTTMVAVIMGAHLLTTKGIGNLSRNNPKSMAFASELILILIAGTNILETALQELLSACGGTKKATGNVAQILYFVELLTAIKVVTRITKQDMEKMLETLGEYLKRTLVKIEEKINIGFNHADDVNPEINIALQQGKLALEKGRIEDFNSTIDKLIDTLGISQSGLNDDLKAITEAAEHLYDTWNPTLDDMTEAGVRINVLA